VYSIEKQFDKNKIMQLTTRFGSKVNVTVDVNKSLTHT